MGVGQSTMMCGMPTGMGELLRKDGAAALFADKSPEEIEQWLMESREGAKIGYESQQMRLERYLNDLTLKQEDLEAITANFFDELQMGLECNKRHPNKYVSEECSFKNLDSCVRNLPSGKEEGLYYALDFGGTNFRVLRLVMKDGEIKETTKKASLASASSPFPKGLLDPLSGAAAMFDFFAITVKELMQEEGDLERCAGKSVPCGFTFSFPCTLRKIDEGRLIVWTKGFETGRQTNDPVEGQDVAQLMNHAFSRNNVPMFINSVANDTVGTLLSCAYGLDRTIHPPCMVALILGTGYNACYFEEKAGEYQYSGRIVNIESGNFNRELPRVSVDHAVDFQDVAGRGRQAFEKMVSGAYIGEICRQAFIKVMQHRAPPKSWIQYSLAAEDSAVICGDRSSNLIAVQRIIFDKWEAEMELADIKALQDICLAVWKRAAALAACCIAACAQKTGYLRKGLGGLTVGIDGSLFKCNAFYRDDIQKFLGQLLGELTPLVHCVLAEDGSGRGAGILAALVANS